MPKELDPKVRWALLVLMAAGFVMQSGFGAVLPVLPLYVHAHGLRLGFLGWMAAAYAGASFIGQVPFGRLSDRIGRMPLLTFGLALNGLCFLSYLLPLPPDAFIALRAIQGLSSAAFTPAAAAQVADLVPPELRGRAYGLFSSSNMAGFAFGPMFGGLVSAFWGMSGSFLAGGAISLAGLFLMPFLPRRPRTTASEMPTLRVFGLLRKLWPLAALNFGWQGVIGMYDTVWAVYMHDLGATNFLIGVSFTLFSVPLVLLSVPSGRLADRPYWREPLIVVGAVLQGLVVPLYALATTPWEAIAISVLEAVVVALAIPAFNATLSARTDPAQVGAAQGMATAAATAGSFCAAATSGYLLEVGRAVPFIFGGGLVVASTLVGALGFWRMGWLPRSPRRSTS